MNQTIIPNDDFIIKRNRKMVLVSIVFGIVCVLYGCVFLYVNLLAPASYCRWMSIVSTGIGIAVIYLALEANRQPLLKADTSGVRLDIVMFGRPIFVPWSDVYVSIEKKGSVSELAKRSWVPLSQKYYETECLTFDFSEEYINKMPFFLKGAYVKDRNKLYFASQMLSIPADQAFHRIRQLQGSQHGESSRPIKVGGLNKACIAFVKYFGIITLLLWIYINIRPFLHFSSK